VPPDIVSDSSLPLCFTLCCGFSHDVRPYMSMGATLAIEDGVTLAECLSRVDNPATDIPLALKAFEYARKSRCELIQRLSNDAREQLHFPDGPAQIKRDTALAETLSDSGTACSVDGEEQVQAVTEGNVIKLMKLWTWNPESEVSKAWPMASAFV
jgi:hypothetical protein